LTAGPRRALGLPETGLAAGERADLVLLDLDAEWRVEPQAFHTLGRHTPFAGETLRGRVLGTWIDGRRVFERPHAEAGNGRSKGQVLHATIAAGEGHR